MSTQKSSKSKSKDSNTSEEVPAVDSKSSITRALNLHGYHLGQKIGRGSFSCVRLAKYVSKNRNVQTLACKVVNVCKGPEEFIKKFFPRELSVLLMIRHPHIVRIHSILKRERMVFIFMDFAEGGDLLRFINRNGAIRESQARRWFAQLVNALRHLHSIDIAHRDLKCENILISRKGSVLLADFGFARVCGEENGNFSNTYCGSLAYVAPEVILSEPYNPMRADVWSLGIILYFMLNAAMPFDSENVMKLVQHQRERNFAFDAGLSKKLSSAAKRTVCEMLEPDPIERITLERLMGLGWIDDSSAHEKRGACRLMEELCVKATKDVRGGRSNESKRPGCKCLNYLN